MSKRVKEAKYERLIKTTKYKTRIFSQCAYCGRRRAFLRDFNMCRICFRNYAHQGLIPGVTKSSW
jgi:small subunit ribosomal protein S14